MQNLAAQLIGAVPGRQVQLALSVNDQLLMGRRRAVVALTRTEPQNQEDKVQ